MLLGNKLKGLKCTGEGEERCLIQITLPPQRLWRVCGVRDRGMAGSEIKELVIFLAQLKARAVVTGTVKTKHLGDHLGF